MGWGVAVSAVGTYVMLAVVGRAVGPAEYVDFSLGWGLLLIALAGLMVPVEQETARLTAAHRARGEDPTPGLVLMKKVGIRFGVVAVGLLLLAAPVLVIALELPVSALAALIGTILISGPVHWLRGALAGGGAFGRYSALLAIEALTRAALATALALANVTDVAPYLVAVGLGTLVAGLVALPAATTRRGSAPVTAPRERTWVLAAATSAGQVVINAPPGMVAMLAASAVERQVLAPLLAAALVARVPLFAFTAVQAGLVPELATRVGGGDAAGMVRIVRKLLLWLTGMTAAIAAVSAPLGEWALVLIFGEEFRLGGEHLAVLSLASGAYLLAATCAAALVVLERHKVVLAAWGTGVVTLALVAVLVPGTMLKVELGLLAGCLSAALVLLASLWRQSRQPLSRPSNL